ncbi:MAG: hypothetical protein AB7V13_26235 [Pseudorhodoplanes sp.]|uniref:hypothetical protein n=1 Tax=Pseudorhodoplanes sp. TaxID=1934341 RepID=UPI003D13E427
MADCAKQIAMARATQPRRPNPKKIANHFIGAQRRAFAAGEQHTATSAVGRNIGRIALICRA